MSTADSLRSDTPQPRPRRIRIHHLAEAKREGRKLSMLTAYDALTAPIFEASGVDMLLVGDSVGNVMLGFDSTLPVTIDDMERHTAAVARSVKRVLLVADLPFGTYEADAAFAYSNATRLMQAGAHAVKLEGGAQRADTIRCLTGGAIPVMGHLGYTPQSEHAIGGPRLQGRGDGRQQLLTDARILEDAGVFALVLEMVPADIAAEITKTVSIPTIGIGAGPHTDGQVLVWSDMAGMTEWTPRFVRRFAELGQALQQAATDYVTAVEDGSFPDDNHYHAN
ncbi:MAG: 3-methyl-2-oxobutanoate hydroxymethyltransferase [Actinobacteria bacterium]|nr:MAG: 3-methyl-2-oxobutanoate hydroxymethyltransferase [Actinomycetota bacterium]